MAYDFVLFLFYIFTSTYIATFGKERGLLWIVVFLISFIFTPFMGMFLVLATPTLKQKELTDLMIEHYKKGQR